MDPGLFRDCDALVRNLQGRSEILAVSVYGEGDIHADHFDGHEDVSSSSESKEPPAVLELSEKMQKQTLVQKQSDNSEGGQVKQNKCSTCDEIVGDVKQYREHFKSDWHKHNLKRKTRQLPPLSAQECMADEEMGDVKGNLNEYNF